MGSLLSYLAGIFPVATGSKREKSLDNDVTVEHHRSYDLVTITGSFNDPRKSDYVSRIMGKINRKVDVVVCFNNLTDLPPATSASILYLAQALSPNRRHVVVTGNEKLRELIKISKIDAVVDFKPTVEEAISHYKALEARLSA